MVSSLMSVYSVCNFNNDNVKMTTKTMSIKIYIQIHNYPVKSLKKKLKLCKHMFRYSVVEYFAQERAATLVLYKVMSIVLKAVPCKNN